MRTDFLASLLSGLSLCALTLASVWLVFSLSGADLHTVVSSLFARYGVWLVLAVLWWLSLFSTAWCLVVFLHWGRR